MKVNSKSEVKLTVQGNDIQEVDSFTYLGANVTKDGGGSVDIRRRIALASAQFKRMTAIWKAGDINRKTKASLFKSLVLSVLLYGCETWKLTKAEEEKLDSFQSRYLRKIFKIHWQQHIPNSKILEIANTRKISEEVRRRRWNWIGHILRREPRNDCAVALEWRPEGKRKRGRPKLTWRRTVETERKGAGWSTWTSVRHSAADRTIWRNDVEALCAPRH